MLLVNRVNDSKGIRVINTFILDRMHLMEYVEERHCESIQTISVLLSSVGDNVVAIAINCTGDCVGHGLLPPIWGVWLYI